MVYHSISDRPANPRVQWVPAVGASRRAGEGLPGLRHPGGLTYTCGQDHARDNRVNPAAVNHNGRLTMTSSVKTIQFLKQPKLRDPLFVAAFEGWNDGGVASTNGVKRLIDAFQAEKFASIDPEEFYVFSENRPLVKLTDGRARKVVWQTNDFFHAPLPGTNRDVILFHGTEPNLHWNTYCSNLLSVAEQHEVRDVVTLGAFLADVLYTLPIQVNGFSSNREVEEKFALKRSSY